MYLLFAVGRSFTKTFCVITLKDYSTESHSGTFPVYQSLVLEDVGLFDGIQRVLFAFRPGGIWLSSILLLDTIVYLSKGTFHASPPSSHPFSSQFSGIVSKMNISSCMSDIAYWFQCSFF
ncbi:unnamed protein product [Schistosoma curassoni]|uniref:HSNSD domain-containing protein n=1 Tax=Schistosoma curassoni TaxID=6186 RepID=A0A183L4F7_9TREM|nr:unnamed protein product [Schistosoma curassoni]